MKSEYKIVSAFLFLAMIAGSGSIMKLIDSNSSEEYLKYGGLTLLLLAISVGIGLLLQKFKVNISFNQRNKTV
jgi:hypothetical protein